MGAQLAVDGHHTTKLTDCLTNTLFWAQPTVTPPLPPPPLPPRGPPQPSCLQVTSDCENYSTYKTVTRAFLGTLLMTLVTGIFICFFSWWIPRRKRRKLMRDSWAVYIVSFLKTANIAILSTLAGCIATTACTCGQVLTAQNAANIVNVVSITYGANDLFPHGRSDIINGAIGSLAAEAALGIYGPCNMKLVRASTWLSIAFNACLVLPLTIVDIDDFCRLHTKTPRKSIEWQSYFTIRHFSELSTCARRTRICICCCAAVYSFANLIVFHFIKVHDCFHFWEEWFAWLPFMIAIVSYIVYACRDIGLGRQHC